MVDKVKNPYREMSDDSLIGRASVSGAAQGALIGEVTRRLKVCPPRPSRRRAADDLRAAALKLAGDIPGDNRKASLETCRVSM